MAESKESRWWLSSDGEYYGIGPYDSKDEAIFAGIEMYREVTSGAVSWNDLYCTDDGTEYPEFWVGRESDFVPTIYSAEVVDALEDHAYTHAGDAASGWLYDLPAEALDMLEKALNAALGRWLKYVKREPSFFGVEDEEEIDPRNYTLQEV